MTRSIGSLLLLGASGDLSGRLLLPALGQLFDREEARRDVVLVGAGSETWDAEAWRDRVKAAFESGDVSDETLKSVLETTHYEQADVTSPEDLKSLIDSCPPAPAVYFALPPSVTVVACTALQQVSLPEGTNLVLEKPFGTDQESAAKLNQLLAKLVPEEHIHRVDHFLGRSTVLNLIGVRFANRLCEPLWSNEHVARVDIIYDEQLTLEGRARYYDRAGALVDMIQSHLLQVMALVAAPPVAAITAFDLREAKAEVLRSCRVWGDDPARSSRRARYANGTVDGRQVPDYVDEPGVDPSRDTETLAEVVLEVNNWRWAGVPFRLRSGKSVGVARKEVVLTFRPAPHVPTGLTGEVAPDRLRLVLNPDAMALEMNVNGENNPMTIERLSLDTDLNPGRLPAYGEVLAGVLDGDPLLAVRGDTAVDCWRIIDPVLEA